MPADCPPPEHLAAFHRGDPPPADIDRVAAHLERCPLCEAALQKLDGNTGSLAEPPTPPRPTRTCW